MSLDFSKFAPAPEMDMNTTRQALGTSSHLRLSQFKANGNTWNPKLDKANADLASAKENSDTMNSPGAIAGDTVRGTANTLLSSGVKFLKSAVAAPIDAVRSFMGKAPIQMGGSDLYGKPITTIEQDADTATQDVMAGDKSPLQATAELTGSTVAGAADVLGAGEGFAGAGDSAIGKFLADKTISSSEKTALRQTIEDVSPRLTPKTAETVTTKTSGISGKISVVPEKYTLDTAQAVHDTIKAGKTFSEKANLADKGISQEAEALKAKIKSVDHAVPKRELVSALEKTERPVLIASDVTMNNAFTRVLTKAKDIIAKMDGTVSGTLDGRKLFDEFVEKQFPNLYNSDTMTPMRTAIKDLRTSWNDFTESQLPDNVDLKESLDKQSKLFDARDTLREKAARGAPKTQGEIGTNRFQRFAKAHPKTIKTAKWGAGVAATSAGVGEVVKHAP